MCVFVQVEITLTSKDEREFKVDAQVAIMSETVKSMLGIDDPSEEVRDTHLSPGFSR